MALPQTDNPEDATYGAEVVGIGVARLGEPEFYVLVELAFPVGS